MDSYREDHSCKCDNNSRHSLSEHVDKLTVYREPDNKERLGTSKNTEINNPAPVGLLPTPGSGPGLLAQQPSGTHTTSPTCPDIC